MAWAIARLFWPFYVFVYYYVFGNFVIKSHGRKILIIPNMVVGKILKTYKQPFYFIRKFLFCIYRFKIVSTLH